MRWARQVGCGTYDLRSIPDQDSECPGNEGDRSTTGTRSNDGRRLDWFTTGFGGKIATHPAMIERRHVPVLPWLARNLRVIKR